MSAAFAPFGGDPVPADLAIGQGLQSMLAEVAAAALSIGQTLGDLGAGADSSVWAGTAADAFRDRLKNLPDLVGKVERSYGDAAEAVRVFLVSANQTRTDADALTGAAYAASDDHTAALALDPASPDAAARTTAAATAVSAMTAKVTALHGDYTRAEATLVASLSVARSESIPPDSAWHHFVAAVEQWTQKLGTALAIAVIIAAVILVIVLMAATGAGLLFAIGAMLEILGPVFTAMMALGAVHLAAAADHKIQYGDDGTAPSWTSIGVETAMLVVPMGAGKAVEGFALAGGEGDGLLAAGSRLGDAFEEVKAGFVASRNGEVAPSLVEATAGFRAWLLPDAPLGDGDAIAIFNGSDAGGRLEEIDQAGGGHTYARHGAQTTLDEQFTRATTGRSPDGYTSEPVDSSRFLSNQDQLEAIDQAETIRSQSPHPGKSIVVDMGHDVGEGYPRGATSTDDLIRTTNVRVVFNSDGTVRTAYPQLSAKGLR